MNSNTLESGARDRLRVAEERFDALVGDADARIAALQASASPSDVNAIENEFAPKLDAAKSAVNEARTALESAQKISRARAASRHMHPAGSLSVREPATYDPRNPEGPSFFADLF